MLEIKEGSELFTGHITDEQLAAEQLAAEYGADIAPEVFKTLTARQAHAMMLRDKGCRGDALARQMRIFDIAAGVEPEGESQ